MIIRDAVEEDLPGILTIVNDVIAASTAIWRDSLETPEERRAWLVERQSRGFPVLVAVDRTGVLGFSSYAGFRSAEGYRHSVEHSVHVRGDTRGRGVGTALMHHLLRRAPANDVHVMVGAVDGSNSESLRFHARLGFEEVAHFREVGRKFGRWLDLVCVQRLF
jgi:L-amino acid N-acyltransferase YncA